jgi:hypothetical protein
MGSASPLSILNSFYRIFGSCKTNFESGPGRRSKRSQRAFHSVVQLFAAPQRTTRVLQVHYVLEPPCDHPTLHHAFTSADSFLGVRFLGSEYVTGKCTAAALTRSAWMTTTVR